MDVDRLLLKPLVAGSLQLKNRLVMPPMATAKSTEENNVSDELLKYYDEKSKGGHIGLIIIEHSYVSVEGRLRTNQISVSKDADVEGLKRLAETIHKNGSKCVMQINHAGGQVIDIGTDQPLSPSGITNPPRETTPKIMTLWDIENVVIAFGNAAARVKAAGFDGVEIHAAHGYLLNQFYSPLTNKRTDHYGGDLQGRIKIHLEIIKAIKDQVGNDFPILMRLGASDYMEGGTVVEDSIVAAEEFKKAGICILDVTGGMCRYSPRGLSGQGYFSPLTEAIKEAVDIPVILTGGITDSIAAEDLLRTGKTDLVGVGRSILNDSEWAKAAMAN